ncbi:hypothetical protein Dda_3391 [Drechslerella dactyloides]|uniref:Uncharacterized protein n=1 Tax=Drechslerella dactyloides TaxID=74499 RepID=A0AAD6J1H4_DREDA|nr:hypothetical protein Dda_3391 [Drechslerella dactyloides]
MSETVKRFKPTLQTATQTSHGAYGSNANSPSSPLPRSPMQLTDSPASYFHLATSPVSAAGSGAGSGTGSSVASVPSATTPSESKASGGFGFNMSSLFGRSKTSGERHLSISLPRPK